MTDSDGRSSRFTLEVQHVLRGPREPSLTLRDLEYLGCADHIITARPGDQIALALDAIGFSPPMRFDTVAWVDGQPFAKASSGSPLRGVPAPGCAAARGAYAPAATSDRPIPLAVLARAPCCRRDSRCVPRWALAPTSSSVDPREPRREERQPRFFGVPSSSAWSSADVELRPSRLACDVRRAAPPRTRSSPSAAAPRRGCCRPGCRPSRSSSATCTGRSSRSRRPVGQRLRALEAGHVAGHEVGRGLVGERLARLVVADDPVEPLVGRLVGRQVAQVAHGDAGRDPDETRRLHPVRRRPTGRP